MIDALASSDLIYYLVASLSLPRLIATNAIYKEIYGNDDSTLPATFQIFYWIGWKPDKSQPKPLDPQKSEVSLKDLYKLDEVLEQYPKKPDTK